MDEVRNREHLSRRDFLKLGAIVAAGALAQGCGGSQPATPTAAPPAAAPKASPQVPAAAAPGSVAPTAAPAATASGVKRGGTFTLARTAGIQEFNPVNLVPGHYGYTRAMYNTLAHYDAQLNPQPELAESWDLSPDGKTMTLHLRQGVKFHSGREFTSDDVKSSVQFASTNQASTMRTMYATVKQVDTPDKYTAVLRFDKLNPGIFDLLDTLFIIDKDTINDRAKTGIGTGPFKLDKYVPNDRAEMVAFKDYWEPGKPYLDKYVLRQVPDLSTLSINLESGAVDCIWQPTFLDLVRLKNSGGKYAVDMGAPGSIIYNLGINVKVEPFTDKRVRQAMAWSIDRARFCKTTLQGLVEPTCLMWPPNSWAYFKDLEGKIGFDLDKAKGLLKDAGLEKGFDTEILTSSDRSFGMGDLAQIIQANLKQIGVNAKIADVEAAQYDNRLNKGDIVTVIHTYGRTNRDPGSLVTGAKAWYNEKQGGWCHFELPAWDKLVADLESTMDKEKRVGICRQIQEMALDESFTNPVAPQDRAFSYASYVKGFSYDLDNAPRVGDFWLDK